MMPSCSSSFRRGSLITQLDFDDIVKVERQDFLFQGTTCNGEHSLQVVPDLDGLRDDTGLEKHLTDLHFTWPRIAVNMVTSQGEPYSTNESYPRSPFLPKTSISEIDNMGLLSPLFSLSNTASPVLKTPSTLYEICCSSRKSSDDLSIYLPDNFTPASLESLDKSIHRTVFQFPPTTSRTYDENVFLDDKSGKISPTCIVKTPQNLSIEQEVSRDSIEQVKAENLEIKRLDDIASVKEKRAKEKRRNKETKINGTKRRKHNNNEIFNEDFIKEPSPLLRNKMERDRRNDLNNRFQKLRESMPEDVAKDNVSKISILKAATSYVEDLVAQEHELYEISQTEKKRNKQLLKKLVTINQSISK